MISQPLVSVVTPVYNNAEYLAECIESVLSQTYQNWEYTIVNNCSTDGSVEIAHRYAGKDPRIRVHQNAHFLPVIANHNFTVRQISARSKYCKMIFADDWIFPECLERMVAVAESHPTVGLVGAYCLWGTEVGWTGLPYPSTVVPGKQVCRQRFLNGLYVFGSATSLLFRADLVRDRDPFYDDQNLHSDSETCHALLRRSDFGFVHQVLTCSRKRDGALSSLSSEYNSYPAGFLHELILHGRYYLTPEEFDLCLDRHLAEYYRFLGKSVLVMRNKDFWAFHRRELVKAGAGLQWTRLACATLAEFADRVLNPKDSLLRLIKRMSRPRSSSGINHGGWRASSNDRQPSVQASLAKSSDGCLS